MAIEYNFEEIKLANRVPVGSTQATIECVIDTSAKGGVSKILSLCGDLKCNSATSDELNIKISGVLNCKVICLNIDGQFTSYDYNCDFSTAIPNKDSKFYEDIKAKGCILDMDSAINDNQIRIQAVCDISANALESRNINILTNVRGDIFAKENDVEVQQIVAKISHNFTVIEEYESGVNIDKVLLFDSDSVSCSAVVSQGMITVNGEIAATVVYESGGSITTKSFLLPFSEEISEAVTYGDAARIRVMVSAAKIVLGGNEDNNIMRLEFTIEVSGCTYTIRDISVIEDVYSTTNKLTVKQVKEEFYSYTTTTCFKEKIAGTAELAENMPGVRRVLSCCASRNCITNLYAGDNCITAEGVLAASVIYEDANTEINSLQIELPYSLPFDTDLVDEDDRLWADALVEILSVKVKRDREIEVTALITLQVEIEEDEELECITELTVGEAKPCDDSAITIYQPRAGEGLWEIAKAVGAAIPTLLKQNQWLNEGESSGQKVLFYRQLTAQ